MRFILITTLFRNITIKHNIRSFACAKMCEKEGKDRQSQEMFITEGQATVKTTGNVFYNPVQEFNRDLSISALNAFASRYILEKKLTKGRIKEDVNVTDATMQKQFKNDYKCGTKYEDGITILEALAATGLRSIRYAKEIAGVKQILANDISHKAVETMKINITDNKVEELVIANQNDATMVMYERARKEFSEFDVIDLDPYGCPSPFLDAAVQTVSNGGLLLVTATDMAVLAGNSPETCYSKYGAVSLKIKCCHEMALRILLQSIESHANRYGRYIVPLLSISADFYIRVFIRVYTSQQKCKFTTSKLSMVYHCTGCDSFNLQPLGIIKQVKNNAKFALPTGPFVGTQCEHCKHPFHLGGPIWSGPLHSTEFVNEVLETAKEHLTTYKRIVGVLNVILEELQDVPLYYTLDRLSGTMHCETPSMIKLRSAILNAGYQVSYTHMNKNSVKTNAPAKVIWDIMRCWVKQKPINEKRLTENSPAKNILSVEAEKEYSFEPRPDANPESKQMGLVRFQLNPSAYWGPGTRATAMVGEEKVSKSKRNQGKRKREPSDEENTETISSEDKVQINDVVS